MMKFLGTILAFSLAPNYSDRRELWETDATPRLVPSMNLGKYLPRGDFERILRNLRVGVYTPEEERADRWLPASRMVEAFNYNRERLVDPGETICVDESFSRRST